MDVNVNSSIWKFLAYNHVNGSELRIPSNLCPFMRRFFFSVGLVFIAYLVIAALGLGMLFIPLGYLLSIGVNDDILAFFLYVFGLAAYTLVLISGGVFAIDTVYNSVATRNINSAIGAAYKVIKKNIFWQWMSAIHDKICPQLTFVDKEKGIRYE